MPDAPVLGGSKKVALDAAAFEARFNGPLVHESVRAELNARRRGTAATKTRGEVRGGGAKPWRQKGTGRARAGSSRSPIWAGGGITFGPKPRRYTFKVNRKERRAALRSALSVHAERGTIAILDAAPFDEPSTKRAHELIAGWSGGGSVLVVLAEEQAQVALSFRNLRRVSVLPASDCGVADIVGSASMLVSEEALQELTRRATGERAEQPAAAGEPAPAAGEPAPTGEEPAPAAESPAPAATDDAAAEETA
jgi:large subunit ribosomal protein L4